MKSHLFLFFLFSYSFIIVSAQKTIPDFGKVSIDELKMTECSFEKNAPAMNLIKTAKIGFGITGFSSTPKLTSEYRVRIKIFNERGFQSANIKIPYSSRSKSSKITDIEAFIYSLDADGKIVKEKVERKQVFNEKINAKKAVNYVAFTFPNLKTGSVIEYRYTKIDKNSLRVEPWLFQDLIPTAVSRVSAAVPAYVKMHYHVIVSDTVEKDSAYKTFYIEMNNEETRFFTMRNIHSFRVEPMMSSLKDNLQRVEFSLKPANTFETFLSASADKLKFYNGILLNAPSFGRQFSKHIDGTDQFIDSVKKLQKKEDKIASVYNYVKKNVEWNDELTFYCDSLENCIKNKTGSNADMNLLLLNLLRKTGVKCFPLLISTRENGNPDPSFGSLSQFNGIDIYIFADSPTYYIVDCTQKNLSYKIPPYNILNSNAYLVDPNINGWVFINDPRILMQSQTYVNADMDSSGEVKGFIDHSLIGFAKTETLAEMKKQKEKGKKEDEEKNVSINAVDLIIDSISVEHEKEDNDTLTQKINFHFTPASTDKAYFLNPFMFSTFRRNPFQDSTRFTDIDFGCNQSYNERILINIPDNFSIESLPKNMLIRLKDSSISFTRQFYNENNHLVVRNLFIIKQSFFFKEDYLVLKSFFDRFYALLNEEILLKKKE